MGGNVIKDFALPGVFPSVQQRRDWLHHRRGDEVSHQSGNNWSLANIGPGGNSDWILHHLLPVLKELSQTIQRHQQLMGLLCSEEGIFVQTFVL